MINIFYIFILFSAKKKSRFNFWFWTIRFHSCLKMAPQKIYSEFQKKMREREREGGVGIGREREQRMNRGQKMIYTKMPEEIQATSFSS